MAIPVHLRRMLSIASIVPMMGLGGCEKAMQDMYNQPKYKPLAASAFWPDGRSARPDVAGTVAFSEGALAGTSSGRLARVPLPAAQAPVYPVDDQGNVKADLAPQSPQPLVVTNPLPIERRTLERGRERFDIYCSPCHSIAGDGDGIVPRRGFPHPPSYHIARLRNAPDAHFYNVITQGYGMMYSYADRVAPADRWAIVAYIRALQLSQNARIDDVPLEHRAELAK
ncbi:MAG TPA: cytochrome c [Casimicrobiaceae bacterium]|jgi:mono/diheme cytochrome c family protein|nr:cytochrome c [Casimicrobiaceae bacterium]